MVIGLSGGIDCALVAALAVDALGPAVRVLAMPSRTRRPRARRTRSSAPSGSACGSTPCRSRTCSRRFAGLADLFAGTEADVAEENLQARIRGNLLMALSNKYGSMVLATGNKSEYAVGYATLYGDMAGGFAPHQGRPEDAGVRARHVAQRAGGEPRSPSGS